MQGPASQTPEPNVTQLHSRVRPRPVVRLNRKAIGALIGCILALVALSLKWRATTSDAKTRTEHEHSRNGYMAHPPGLHELPGDYDQLPKPNTVIAPELPGPAPEPPPPPPRVESHAYHQTRVSEAQREAEAARTSGLFFQSSPRPQRRQQLQMASHETSGVPPARGLLPDRLDMLKTLAHKPQHDQDQNRQVDKEAFLRQAGQAHVPIYLDDRVHDPASPNLVQAGTIIPTVLISGINADLPGMITAQVREPVYDTISGEILLIPQGTRALGQYDSKVVYGQRRVLVAWHRLIMPNGTSISLGGMPGIDLAGYAGVKDKVNHHWGRVFGSVILSSVLSVGARVSAGTISSDQGISPGEQFALEAGGNFNQVGQDLVRKNLNMQPTLEIRPGFAMNILVHKDMVMRPYDASQDQGVFPSRHRGR
jgi:type IV secretion system protein TrbI